MANNESAQLKQKTDFVFDKQNMYASYGRISFLNQKFGL